MNEDEIIKQFEKMCIFDENCIEVDCLEEKDLEAIRSLYNLYNKEKEKNNKLKKENEKNNKLKKENEALEIIHECYKEMVEENNLISKDKIREKINYVLGDITGEGEEAEYGARCLAKEILELLEE